MDAIEGIEPIKVNLYDLALIKPGKCNIRVARAPARPEFEVVLRPIRGIREC